jgi:hypothetical protein
MLNNNCDIKSIVFKSKTQKIYLAEADYTGLFVHKEKLVVISNCKFSPLETNEHFD